MARFATVIVALLFMAAAVQAEEIRGKVKSVEGDKNQITLLVGTGERTVVLAKDVKVFGTFSQRFRRSVTMEITNGLASLTPNTHVWITTEPRDGVDKATSIQIEGVRRRALLRQP